jgi:uncharacterized membrane protein YuzA (DUF378 family)
LFPWLAPLGVGIVLATVYLRLHCLTDLAASFLLAPIAWQLGTAIGRRFRAQAAPHSYFERVTQILTIERQLRAIPVIAPSKGVFPDDFRERLRADSAREIGPRDATCGRCGYGLTIRSRDRWCALCNRTRQHTEDRTTQGTGVSMTTPRANDASSDLGLDRFLNVITFAARVGVLNAGLMGVFHWNLVDLVLGSDPSQTATMIGQSVCLTFGLLSVIALMMLSQRPLHQVSPATQTEASVASLNAMTALRTGQLEPVSDAVNRNSVIA